MKRILFFVVLMGAVHGCWAGKVTLPGDVLEQKLKKHGFELYCNSTDIVDQLADKELEVSNVVAIVDATFQEYCKAFKDTNHEERDPSNKLFIIHALLLDHTAAYKEAISLINLKK